MNASSHAVVLSGLVDLLQREYDVFEDDEATQICISHYLNWIKKAAEVNDLPLSDIGLEGYTIPDPLKKKSAA